MWYLSFDCATKTFAFSLSYVNITSTNLKEIQNKLVYLIESINLIESNLCLICNSVDLKNKLLEFKNKILESNNKLLDLKKSIINIV